MASSFLKRNPIGQYSPKMLQSGAFQDGLERLLTGNLAIQLRCTVSSKFSNISISWYNSDGCCVTRQIPDNPPDYQKYYRQMNKVKHRHVCFSWSLGLLLTHLCRMLPGRFPLQHPRLWLDRGRLHGRGPEVSDAAAGALSLRRPACRRRATVRRRQCGED